MHLRIFGRDIYYEDASGWDISGTGDSAAMSAGIRDIPTPGLIITAGISVGAAWGNVRFSPNGSSRHARADLDVSRGHHLRPLERWYEATMYGVTVSASAQTITFQLPIGGSVSLAKSDFDSHGIGPVRRMAGAPTPAGEGGGPTGFLGVAAQFTGSTAMSQGMNAAVSSLMMGSNIAGLLQGKAPGWLADNLAHAGNLFLGHLAYKYTGAYYSTAATVSTALASAGVSGEFQMAYIGIIDMYVKEDGRDWYVHSYELDGSNNVVTTDRSFQVRAPSYRQHR